MEKKIAVFTVGRSDLSILKNLILKIKKSKIFSLKLYVGPAHNSKTFGNTKTELWDINLKNYHTIKLNYNNSKSSNYYFSKILNDAETFINKYKIEAGFIMGDRYEMLAISLAMFGNNIPILHLCGGSVTEGSLDNVYRYCISKMSKIHLVETKHHLNNLKKIGIKKNVHIVGAPGLENIKRYNNSQKLIEKKYNLKLNNENTIMCTFHPETNISKEKNLYNLRTLISFVKSTEKNVIFTYPNADDGYNKYIKTINSSFKNCPRVKIIKSLGIDDYYKCLNFVQLIIGNSSSGIIESASFGIPCINIGNRQKGRYAPTNVFHCPFSISKLNKIYKIIQKKNIRSKFKKMTNPYYKVNTSSKIFKILKNSF